MTPFQYDNVFTSDAWSLYTLKKMVKSNYSQYGTNKKHNVLLY